MKAVGYSTSHPITHPEALLDIDLPQPIATGHDILVKVAAIAVNPVDYKIRLRASPDANSHKVLGWDAAGEVIAIGEAVTRFSPGDKVYYAGDLNRQGSNAEFQVVDERIVGTQPQSLSAAEAAALPLTTITAWEMLFDHLALRQQNPDINEPSKEVILVVGASGGVGSILIQLAKAITGATIIATASRESSQAWVKNLGAHYVVDHSQALQPQVEALDIGPLTHVASLNGSDAYFGDYIALLAPFGKIAVIDDPKSFNALNVMQLKQKSLSLHFEFMFARSMFNAEDIAEQGRLLNQVTDLVDHGYIKTTAGKNLGAINAENLKTAHTLLESGRSIGKIVLEGF